ncbi:serine carboxypeptidase [Thelephora ganbajun]|uniref:Serine carboxypeptidase n=1 Tax=Thelephora ganbajun TaxID=370292 RepID=A0ACB6Z6R5_THEGA|nr:serine carboxypeptidase [Thelephora ganbajun]
MLLSSLAVLVAALPIAVLGGEFPVYNGVVGGAPINVTVKEKVSEISVQDFVAQAGALRFVANSGVCETTSGVYTASGYADLTSTQHMWFWFFAARNSPDTAPLTVWLNGGPGSSSMIGLFQEHGPCLINNDSSTVRLNPQSWNENSNVLYLDQPVGVGFSYGDATTSSSLEAAQGVWNFLQTFFSDANFSKYKDRNFALWTESYGGHYGPTMASYFLDQNAAIAAGTLSGIPINLKALGIGNGLTDPITQYPGYISYAKTNPYHPLVSDSTISSVSNSYFSSGGCRDQILQCASSGTNSDCSQAQSTCNNQVLSPLSGPWDVYYVPSRSPSGYPADFTDWLNSQTSSIGADVTWSASSSTIYNNFFSTGDWMRSTRPYLEKVINAGVRTAIYDGDADYICNYQGVENMVDALQHQWSSQYASTPFTSWTVDGVTAGQFKNAGPLSYVRIYQAGHLVPAFTVGNLPYGRHALTLFNQAMAGQPISST